MWHKGIGSITRKGLIYKPQSAEELNQEMVERGGSLDSEICLEERGGETCVEAEVG